jgi:hypothetical protein
LIAAVLKQWKTATVIGIAGLFVTAVTRITGRRVIMEKHDLAEKLIRLWYEVNAIRHEAYKDNKEGRRELAGLLWDFQTKLDSLIDIHWALE